LTTHVLSMITYYRCFRSGRITYGISEAIPNVNKFHTQHKQLFFQNALAKLYEMPIFFVICPIIIHQSDNTNV